MSMTAPPAFIRRSVLVKADAARAFDVFTHGIARWWLKSHSIGKSPQVDVTLEPFEGGRWYERGADGSECQWGRVLVWQPPTRLVLAWQIDATWQLNPDFLTEVEVRFTPQDGGTRVELEHRGLEKYGDQQGTIRGLFESPNGWSGLLEAFTRQIE